MKVKITPQQLNGTIEAIPSKSHAHRLLIAQKLAALQGDGREDSLQIPAFSEDIAATKDCLTQLDQGLPRFDCRESGSTIRFMIPVAMALKDEAVFAGSGKLPQRPLSPLKEEMERHGCSFGTSAQDADSAKASANASVSGSKKASGRGVLESAKASATGDSHAADASGRDVPEAAKTSAAAGTSGTAKTLMDAKDLEAGTAKTSANVSSGSAKDSGRGVTSEICRIRGRLQPGKYELAGNISSQFITGLLFALPLLDGDSSLQLTTKLESAGYVDLTLQVLREFGIEIREVREMHVVRENRESWEARETREVREVIADGDAGADSAQKSQSAVLAESENSLDKKNFPAATSPDAAERSDAAASPKPATNSVAASEWDFKANSEIPFERNPGANAEFSSGNCLIRYEIPGNQVYREPEGLKVEGDWSNAAFWLVAGALGGDVTCTGLNPQSAQRDKEIITVLEKMGAKIERKNTVYHISENSIPLHGETVSAAQFPDLVPVIAVAMTGADGASAITDAQRLRIKESDRLATVCDFLTILGTDIRQTEDGLIIHENDCKCSHEITIKDGRENGCKDTPAGTAAHCPSPPLSGGTVSSHNDHRIAMAAAVASCRADGPVIITGAEAVKKSYPDFFTDFTRLGGKIEILED